MAGPLVEFVGDLKVSELALLAGLTVEELAGRVVPKLEQPTPKRAAAPAEHNGSPAAPTSPPGLDPAWLVRELARVCQFDSTDRKVAYLLLFGHTDRQIADRLRCSERTAKRYVGHVLAKTGSSNRAGVLRILFEGCGHTVASMKAAVQSGPIQHPRPRAD
jgi:DNA-binding NarL/FixJ family response regulator